MKLGLFFYFSIFFINKNNAQPNFGIANKTFNFCGSGCNSLNFTLPNLKTTADYNVTSIPYLPFSYKTNIGTVIPFLHAEWGLASSVIPLSFDFCFYDSLFKFVVLSNTGIITFDTTNKGPSCAIQIQNAFPIPASGTNPIQCIGTNYYPKSCIFIIMYEFDPRNIFGFPSAADRQIEYRIEGQAPFRRFIYSFYKIGTWGTHQDPMWWPNQESTFQAVLYETTNLIEIYVEKFVCIPAYASGGKPIMGLQNWERNKAVWPPGKNNQPWTAVNEAFQFKPKGNNRFLNSKLYTAEGTFLQTANTQTIGDSLININFNNVCNSANKDTTVYFIKSQFKACSDSDTLTLTDTVFYINAKVRTINDTNICKGNAIQLVTNNGASIYNWQPSTGLNSSNISSPIASPNITTTYTVTATKDTCITKDTVQVVVTNKPIISLPATLQIAIGGSAIINAQVQNFTSLQWLPSTNLNNATILTPTVSLLPQSTFYKLIANNNNCMVSDSLLVNVIPNCGMVKEGFTPNGDGINDFWSTYDSRVCYKRIKATVYNRFGSLVYKNEDYYNVWDGTFNGKPLPDGTYYYKLSFALVNGETLLKQGNVSIIR